ncbi:MAG TPA: CBS domain-containing protein [Thermoanaerobaculia bacterium]|nr:CBS domain-containing protein [Thermoanaerobaculia bacterium]
MLVRDLMTEQVLALGPNSTLQEVDDLMQERHIRHVPVVDHQGDLIGLISHRDLLRNSLIEQGELPSYVENAVLTRLHARDVMVTSVEAVAPETDLREAAQIMLENKYGCLPVVEGRRLVGILTEADFVRLLAQGN